MNGKKLICFFGTYSPENLRNRVLLLAFRSLKKYTIVEINTQIPTFQSIPIIQYLVTVCRILIELGLKLKKLNPDVVIIPYPGVLAIFIARMVVKRPLIFDPYISMYESNLTDYKTFKSGSLIAYLYYFIEYHAFNLGDIVLADTNQHINLYKTLFHIKKPMYRIWVGTDPSVLQTKTKNEEDSRSIHKKFIVSFIGTYIPLQGIEYIVKSAQFLQDKYPQIHFEIIGGGREKQDQLKKQCGFQNFPNISFIDPVPLMELKKYIIHSDIQLGIFGLTPKARRVIPNKGYMALAAKKPLITADTPAIRELLTHKATVYLCKAGDGQALADAITELYQNEPLRLQIASHGSDVFYSTCTPKKIGLSLDSILTSINRRI